MGYEIFQGEQNLVLSVQNQAVCWPLLASSHKSYLQSMSYSGLVIRGSLQKYHEFHVALTDTCSPWKDHETSQRVSHWLPSCATFKQANHPTGGITSPLKAVTPFSKSEAAGVNNWMRGNCVIFHLRLNHTEIDPYLQHSLPRGSARQTETDVLREL